MRGAFFKALVELAVTDPRIMLVVGDLGFGVAEEFARLYPDRFINVGVAEQNMTGLATGLALGGRTVFTYSIGNFPTIRCLEQIRNDVCYHGANVKVVTVGGGLSYGSLGSTHHTTEDLAIMRAMPNLVVIAPGDPVESRLATRAIAAFEGPCYLRLSRAGEVTVQPEDAPFAVGRALLVRAGADLTLISTGGMLATTVAVARRLGLEGFNARVLSMHTLKPLDTDAILAAARETSAIATIEEHSLIGGLGGAVAEVLAESSDRLVPFRRIALPSAFCETSGSQQYLKARAGLSEEGVLEAVRRLLGRVPVADAGLRVSTIRRNG